MFKKKKVKKKKQGAGNMVITRKCPSQWRLLCPEASVHLTPAQYGYQSQYQIVQGRAI